MTLATLLDHVTVVSKKGNLNQRVSGITRDSRTLGDGIVFVAISGQSFDGHEVVETMTSGMVVVERDVVTGPAVTVVRVENSRQALAELSSAFYDFPSQKIPVIGITGTNGKTTVTTLVEQALSSLQRRVGRIGTTGIAINGKTFPTSFTTPEAPELQAILSEMVKASCEMVLMEVSSIGLDMHRVHNTQFHAGVFTNLSHDHLDFHGSWEAYRAAKTKLFEQYLRPASGLPRTLVWGEDPSAAYMALHEDIWTYGFGDDFDWSIEAMQVSAEGMSLELETPYGTLKIESNLVGRFNALNLVASLAIGVLLGVPISKMALALTSVVGAPGRMERIAEAREFMVIVDYAHSPDALERAICALQEIAVGQVGVVFGCGGDRDQPKRAIMGRVAEERADWICLTSDNPRSESPEAIVDDICRGLKGTPANISLDRRDAIAWALRRAKSGDIVLIAGKGHETYQEAAGRRTEFDDRAVARQILAEL